jgi:hypothetical protein
MHELNMNQRAGGGWISAWPFARGRHRSAGGSREPGFLYDQTRDSGEGQAQWR